MRASERRVVGVVGDRALASVVEDAGARTVAARESTEPREAARAVLAEDPDWVVAGSEDALTAFLEAGAAEPVLAVDADVGVPGVPRDGVSDAVGRILDGEADTVGRRLFAATVDGERAATMLRDAMLVTAEPARISEYAVHTAGRRVASFRADGVVVATPAGSEGYLSAAGGPVLEPGTGTLAAVPVAPFRTERDHWVLDDGAVSLSVEREGAVQLVVDGTERRQVPLESAVTLRPDGELSLYAPGEDWKNSNGRRTE